MSGKAALEGRRSRIATIWAPIAAVAAFIFLSAFIRPVIPPDETRYLTVAWEMWVRHDFVLPTLNFAAYHQKPPMLFWLIDIFWAILGVSRYSALVAIFVASSGVVLVTRALARELFPGEWRIIDPACWLMVGNVVFVVYCGLVMFDLLLAVFTALALLALLVHARRPSGWTIAMAGISTGLAVLTKGPVVLLFLAPVVLSYPLWQGERYTLPRKTFFKDSGWALLVSLVPVLLWLLPLLAQTGFGFLDALIWKQAAGRVTGNIETGHSRPIWFYLPLLPVFLMPWIFSIDAWRAHGSALRRPLDAFRGAWRRGPQVRLFVLATIPSIILFSLVSGKQPHYIVPLLPIMVVATAFLLTAASFRLVWISTVVTLAIFLLGQGVAAFTVFPLYDLSKAAAFLSSRQGPIAIIGKYHGEVGFLSRLTHPMDEVDPKDAQSWLDHHPDGTLIGLELPDDVKLPGRRVFERDYRSPHKRFVAVEPKRGPSANSTVKPAAGSRAE